MVHGMWYMVCGIWYMSRILNKSLKSQGGLTIRAVKEGKGKRRSRQKSGRRGTAGAAWC